MSILNQIRSITLATSVCLAAFVGSVAAEEKEKVFAGTIEINSTQLAFMVSGKVGGGVLEFEGEEYYFDLKGLGAGGIGVKKVNAVGAVYNMTDISQFPGFYTCLLYTSPSPRDGLLSRMPSSA